MIFISPNRQDRERSLLLLGSSAILALGALGFGIQDNSPGLLLAYLAAVALVLVFVHAWRSWRSFVWLAGGALFGIGLFAELHDLFEGLARAHLGVGVGGALLAGVGTACFLIAALLGPALLLVALGGFLVRFAAEHRTHRGHGAHAA